MKNTLKTPQSYSSNDISFVSSSNKKRVSKDGLSTPTDNSLQNSFAKKSLNLNSSFSYSKSSQQNIPPGPQVKLNATGFSSKFKEAQHNDKHEGPNKNVHELIVNANPKTKNQ